MCGEMICQMDGTETSDTLTVFFFILFFLYILTMSVFVETVFWILST